MQIEMALSSAGLAAAYGIAKYMRNNIKDGNGFSFVKFIPTVLISAVAGFIIGGQGMIVDDVTVAAMSVTLAGLGADRVVEAAYKLVASLFSSN